MFNIERAATFEWLSSCTSTQARWNVVSFFGRLNVTFLGQALWNINKISKTLSVFSTVGLLTEVDDLSEEGFSLEFEVMRLPQE